MRTVLLYSLFSPIYLAVGEPKLGFTYTNLAEDKVIRTPQDQPDNVQHIRLSYQSWVRPTPRERWCEVKPSCTTIWFASTHSIREQRWELFIVQLPYQCRIKPFAASS